MFQEELHDDEKNTKEASTDSNIGYILNWNNPIFTKHSSEHIELNKTFLRYWHPSDVLLEISSNEYLVFTKFYHFK